MIEESNLYREGLTVTHSVGVAINHLELMFSDLPYLLRFSERGSKISVFVYKSLDNIVPNEEQINYFLKIVNNLGYYISYYRSDIFGAPPIEYNETSFKDHWVSDHLVNMLLEPKYDPELSESDLPDKAYHTCPSKNEQKILSIGLAPKSKSKLMSHPERVYFSYSVQDVKDLLHNTRFIRNEKEFTILGFDLGSLKNKRVIRYFPDPNFPNKAFYTYENIPPQYLSVVERVRLA